MPPTTLSRLAVAALCLCLPGLGMAGTQPMVFQHLTSEDGLSQDTVMSSLQDAAGFMWFATEDGLDRYDGYSIKRFGPEPGNPESLPGNYIWSIRAGRDGALWLAIKEGGIARFDPAAERFTLFRHDDHDPTSLASDATRQLLIDRTGAVWVATSNRGLDLLNPVTGRATHHVHEPGRADSIANDTISALAEDEAGQIWIGTDAGLDRWSRDARGFTHFTHSTQDARSLSSNQVSSILVDRSGVLWVGTYDRGLNRYDVACRCFTRFTADKADPASLSNDDVRAIFEDRDGRLWIGTANGLNLMDRSTGRFARFEHQPTDPTSLRDNYIMSLYQDRGGLLWVGTRGGGVSRWNPRNLLLGFHKTEWLAGSYIIAFADRPDGKLWIGTQGAGVFLFDPRSGGAEPAASVFKRRALLSDPRVMALLQDRVGNLWVGTMGSGVTCIGSDGSVRTYRADAQHPHSRSALGADGVMSLFETADRHIWVGTFGGGAAIIDPASASVRRLPVDPLGAQGLANPRATSITQGSNGVVWIGTDGGGVSAFHADGSFLHTWRHDARNADSLAADSVYAVQVDRQGRVWIGTNGGGFDRLVGGVTASTAVKFEHLSAADGLPSNIIYGIESDTDGAQWLSTSKGLVHYDPDTHAIRSFHRDHGLQGEDFNFGAHFRLRDGRLAFGGANGFNLFDPAQVMRASAPQPGIALTAVEVLGSRSRFNQPLAMLRDVALGYRDSVISFEFTALDFSAPAKNQYSYRLVGFDDRWTPASRQRRATYTNLDAGQYRLEVRAANSEGVWSAPKLAMRLDMKPAPWRSPLAYALYVACVLMLLWRWQYVQQRKLRNKTLRAQKLEQEVAARTYELQQQNIELIRLSQAKSDFLARMSHEIRTPMNGLIGMAELLQRTALSVQQSKLVVTLHTSARSLMHILNDILDISKVEAGRMQLELSEFDLTEIMTRAADIFGGNASSKNIDLTVLPAADLDRKVVGDALRLGQVMTNLLGNAIKFTPAGQILLRADVLAWREDSVDISIAVQDSGIGMSEEVTARVFEPFTQEDESVTRRFGGTGLGLTICRELIQLMKGRIEVHSRRFEGSTFTVYLTLPLGRPLKVDPSLRERHAVIVSRLSGFAEGLDRCCRQLRMAPTWISPDDAQGDAAARLLLEPPAVVIIDMDSCQDWAGAWNAADANARGCRTLQAGYPETLARIEASSPTLSRPISPYTLQQTLLAPPETAAAACTAQHTPGTRLRGHLLVAEDNEVNAAVIEGFLEELGCSCRIVVTGREAAQIVRTERFDAILMDVHMPDIDGLAATSMIRESAAAGVRIPIIALTANSAGAQRQQCLNAGMDDFLSKPVSMTELQATLSRWLPAPVMQPLEIPAQSKPSAVFDGSALTRIAEMERAKPRGLVRRVTTLFIEGSARHCEALRNAMAANDLGEIRAISHSLKSAAANVGALQLAGIAGELEHAAAEGRAETVAQLLDRLYPAVTRAANAVRAQILRLSA